MPTSRDLSDVERRVLDSAIEDHTPLWQLNAPLTVIEQDDEGGTVRHEEHPPAPHAEAMQAVEHLLDLGFVQLVRRTDLYTRTPIDDQARASILADPNNWRTDGPNDIEVVATDAGRSAWTS